MERRICLQMAAQAAFGDKLPPDIAARFRPVAIQQLLDEHDTRSGIRFSGRINHGKRLWALLMFALWLEGN